MRIMLDTNILISALLFPGRKIDRLMEKITSGHQLVLSSFVVDELMDVVQRKFPSKVKAADTFLSQLPYELVYTPRQMELGLFDIRDENDYPVLYSAIIDDVDLLITGDNDFNDVDVEKPEILTPAEFLDRY